MGVCEHFNLPHSHAQSHIIQAIQLFGSPNGLCSSITESKHIEAVKKPWWQSARYKALKQMLVIHAWTEKMHTVGAAFAMCCMLVGLSLEYARRMKDGKAPVPLDEIEDEDVDEQGAAEGPKVMSSICLVKRQSACAYWYSLTTVWPLYATVYGFSKWIDDVAEHISQPCLSELICHFLYDQLHLDSDIPGSYIDLDQCPLFQGKITTYHSAIAQFYAPSDLCSSGGMHHEHIWLTPNLHGQGPCHDTVLIETMADCSGMAGMDAAHIMQFILFKYNAVTYLCALVHWYQCQSDFADSLTGLWIVKPEFVGNSHPHLAVMHLDSISHTAHLIPWFGAAKLPKGLRFSSALDIFNSYFVNKYVDHHMFKFLSI